MRKGLGQKSPFIESNLFYLWISKYCRLGIAILSSLTTMHRKETGKKSEGKGAPQFDEQTETDYHQELLSIISEEVIIGLNNSCLCSNKQPSIHMSLIQHFLDISTIYPSIRELLSQFPYQEIELWSADLKYSKYLKMYQKRWYMERRQIRSQQRRTELHSHNHVTSHAMLAWLPHIYLMPKNMPKSSAQTYTYLPCIGTGPTYPWQKPLVVCQTELSVHMEEKKKLAQWKNTCQQL